MSANSSGPSGCGQGGALVPRLPHHVEDEIPLDPVVSSEAVVPVDASARPVVAEVVAQRHVRRDRLEVAGGLQIEDSLAEALRH